MHVTLLFHCKMRECWPITQWNAGALTIANDPQRAICMPVTTDKGNPHVNKPGLVLISSGHPVMQPIFGINNNRLVWRWGSKPVRKISKYMQEYF